MDARAWTAVFRSQLRSGRESLSHLVAASLLLAGLAGCGEGLDGPTPPSTDPDSPRIAPRRVDLHDDVGPPHLTLDDPADLQRYFSAGTAQLDPGGSFHQVSLMFDAPPGTELHWRRLDGDTNRASWRPVQITWSEGVAHVGRILLERPAERIELRTSQPLSHLYLEFPSTVTARTDRPLARELPPAGTRPATDEEFRTARQLEAPADLVISREAWGARDPDKICGRSHDPYRMTIHHTASPSDDGGDPARRMRQMQAFHIDDRGWCDIGYHFVVSQSAKIFQGRSTEKRTGAHVGGENQGNIGISLIGNFENQSVNSDQFASTVDIAHWVYSTYEITLDRDHFKGHTEWPNQTTSCPGTNLKSRLDELLQKIGGGGGGSDPDVEFRTTVSGLDNPYEQGSSSDVPDAFPGDSFRAEIILTNRTDSTLQGVETSFATDAPFVVADEYRIDTDAPEHDGSSWRNADVQATGNPPTTDVPNRGTLALGSIAPGESRRVVLQLRAKRYGIGAGSHPGIRAWVHAIDGSYGPQDSWDGSPSSNEFAGRLREAARVDVLSRNEWRFESGVDQKDFEGWTACCSGDYDRAALNQEAGALAVEVSTPDVRLQSPEWTRIRADTYDELLVRIRSHDGPHVKRISWRRQGDEDSETHVYRFRAPGDGAFHSYTIPLGRHPAWSGTIEEIRIEPLQGERPDSDATRWYDLAGLYFRSSETGETTSSRDPFDSESVRQPVGDLPEPNPSGTSGEHEGPGSGSDETATRDDYAAAAPNEQIEVKGCRAYAGNRPSGALGWLFALAVGMVRAGYRRRS